MASPQKENGFTPIANELMDALSKIKLTDSERRILFVVFRKTYGWSKTKDNISLSQFHESTGLPRSNICRAIKSLVARMILGSRQNGTRYATTYWIIKDYDKWNSLLVSSQPRVQNGTITSVIPANRVVAEVAPTKETITKERKKGKQDLIYDMFRNKFLIDTGKGYVPDYAKDMGLLKNKIQYIKSPEQWETMLDRYFNDSFAKQTGFMFSLLISQFNKYNPGIDND